MIFRIIVVLLPLMLSGCLLQPEVDVESSQEYLVELDPEYRSPYKSKEEVIEIIDPATGKVAQRKTVSEWAVPQFLVSNTFRGSDAFVEKELGYEFNSTADGQGVVFNQKTEVNEQSYQTGADLQRDVTEQYVGGFTELGNTVRGINQDNRAFEFEREKIRAQRDIEVARIAALEQPHETPSHDQPAGQGQSPPNTDGQR